MVRIRVSSSLFCLSLAALPLIAAAALREPLPLEVAVSVHGHNGRSPIGLSPDGEWLAHTAETDENVPRDPSSFMYSPTGFPFAEGDWRMIATVTNTRTGESVPLAGGEGTSWAPVWSPDGKRVAFYSDAGGEAGLWIWDRATRKSMRVSGITIRPLFGYEGARWSADSQRLLVKVLPEGVTIAEVNGKQGTGMPNKVIMPRATPGKPSVVVRSNDPEAVKSPAGAAALPGAKSPPTGAPEWSSVDLALVDLQSGHVTRLVKHAPVQVYAFSPDRKSLAYSVSKGPEANSQQNDFDLMVLDLAGGQSRTVASDIRLGYGIEWSWSPDSKTLAYIESGQLAKGELVLIPMAVGGHERRIQGAGLPSFDTNRQGELSPVWSRDSSQIFVLGNGELWRIDARTGTGNAAGKIPGWQVRGIVTPYAEPAIWSSDGGRTVWIVARESSGAQAGIYSVDLTNGRVTPGIREPKAYYGLFNVAASAATGDIAFVSTGMQSLQEIWFFNTRNKKLRQGTHLNPELERYELATARVIDWKGPDDKALHGTLMLPPGYRPGRRLPLVVDVYGGSMGSTYINSFGGPLGTSPMLNMHVLATRGYAILFPDAPVREGHTMDDIVAVVMPGVDAAIAQGYVDPERLAAIGQSYGSYNVLSIVAQTNRFKAASITAAVLHPDLFAAYLGWEGYFEHGQGNMGGSIWEQRQRYFDNSPIFVFDRIQTPLLIGQGERDGDLVPANAMYAALVRLNKPVELRIYGDESHVISQKPNVLDFWQRRMAFFAQHLKLTLDERGAVIFKE